MATRRSVVSSAKLIAICTLVSRVTGLTRDILLARAFGLGWVQDAFSYAFQFPNLFRRLFGEGAMAPAFVPTFTRTLETEGQDGAWRLLAHTLALMTVTLITLIIVIAAVIGVIALFPPQNPELADARRVLLGLTLVMLPFMLFICVLALLSSILNCVGSFVPAAFAPVVLNACMIVALAWLGPTLAQRRGLSTTHMPAQRAAEGGTVSINQAASGAFEVQRVDPGGASHAASYQRLDALTAHDPEAGALFRAHRDRALLTIAYTVAVAVLAAGVLQLVFLYPALRANGVRLGWHWNVRDTTVRQMLRLLPPVALGQGVLAFGVFLDSQICAMLEHVHGTPATASLLGLHFTYPLQEGALSAITYAQRLYQFPLGVLVVSLATAALPAFSRLAAHGQWPAWTTEVRQSLRLAVFEGLLAGVMMIMLPEALTRLLFERGKFTHADTLRTAYVVACYGFGLWAFCAQHIVLRAFYSLGEVRTPLMISVVLLPLNTALNLILIWFPGIREAAFAISSSLTASASVIVGLIILQRRVGQRVFDRATLLALGRMVAAGLVAAAVLAALGPPWTTWTSHLPGRLLPRACDTCGRLALGAAAFLGAASALRLHELNLLLPQKLRWAVGLRPSADQAN